MSIISETMSIDASLSVEGEGPLIADPRSGLLPFGFSKAHQVVLEDAENGLVLRHVGPIDTNTLLEVRRT